MHKARMSKLLTALLNHRDNGIIFHMSWWRMELDRIESCPPELKCKTACCAVGLYVENHPDEGLVIKFNDPEYDGSIGYTALAKFFEISYEDAFALFMPTMYDDYKETDVLREFPRPIPIQSVIKRVEDVMMKYATAEERYRK